MQSIAHTDEHNGFPVLHLVGELDFSMKEELHRILVDFASMGDRLILDLSEVTYLDSSPLGLALGLDARLAGRGGALAITSLQPNVMRVFRVAGLTRLLHVFENPDDASEYLSQVNAQTVH